MFHIVKCHHGIGIDKNVGGKDCSKLCRPLSLTEHCKLNHLLIKKQNKKQTLIDEKSNNINIEGIFMVISFQWRFLPEALYFLLLACGNEVLKA